MVFMAGKLSDKISAKILTPAVLLFQIVVMTAYSFCTNPQSWYAYFLSAFQGGSGFMIIVVMQGYAVKRVPKMIRGITMALVIAFSGVGGIIYLQVSKLFYETAPGMIFGLIAFFDALVLIAIGVSIFYGKYGDPPKQLEDGDDNNSKQTEGETYFGNLDDPGFNNKIEDVPFG